jgi:hypothetical protein
MGLKCRWSNKIDSHMDETIEAMPYEVAPFAEMIEYALIMVFFSNVDRDGEDAGRRDWRGEPPMVAVDQATCRHTSEE